MKKYLWSMIAIMMVITQSMSSVSCSKDDETSTVSSYENYEPTARELQLFDTGWTFVRFDVYENGVRARSFTDSRIPLFFSSKKSYWGGKFIGEYVLCDGNGDEIGFWSTYSTDSLIIAATKKVSYGSHNYLFTMYPSNSYIYKLTSSELRIRAGFFSDDERREYIFTRSTQTPYDDSGNENAGASPEIGFYDFSATKSSITVRYQIFNKDEANINNARIYYGTSSNPTSSVSANVTGVYITATITGLSKGTEYYVKCRAVGNGGSTTTDVTKCITNY